MLGHWSPGLSSAWHPQEGQKSQVLVWNPGGGTLQHSWVPLETRKCSSMLCGLSYSPKKLSRI